MAFTTAASKADPGTNGTLTDLNLASAAVGIAFTVGLFIVLSGAGVASVTGS